MFVTLFATDLIPFDSNLIFAGVNAFASFVKSASKRRVPWDTILFPFIYWAFPDIFAPLHKISFLPLNSALSPNEFRYSMIGFKKRSYPLFFIISSNKRKTNIS